MTISNTATFPIGINLKTTSATPIHDLGQVAYGNYGGQFVYGKTANTIAAGDFVWFDANFNAQPLTTASSPRNAKVGSAFAAMAPATYGWFQVNGVASGKAAAAIAAGARVNTTATSFAIDDDGTVGAKEIVGVHVPSAIGAAGVFEMMLTDPIVGATL